MKYTYAQSIQDGAGGGKKIRSGSLESPAAGKQREMKRLSRSWFRFNSLSMFTLIELLIVIAIIAVLMSVFLPALNKALQSSQASFCRGNLKQQGIAFVTYVQDFMEYFPVYGDTMHEGDTPLLLNPYLGISGKVIGNYFNPFSPDERTPSTPFNGSKTFYCPGRNNKANGVRYVDYGGCFQKWGEEKTSWQSLKLSTLKRSSTSILYVETLYNQEPFGRSSITKLDQIHFRHQNRTNVLYLDAHVSTLSFSELNSSNFDERMSIE